ncbi:MAG: hypothetical protein GC171_06345 [Terrimonas sp.]|nr:hypothetical protein [Terrimonas sp.]
MKSKIFIVLLILVADRSFCQIPEEALRLSWTSFNGTARNQAIGGAMVSLGGDATANITNPAGLAFFKTSDFVLTPAYQFGKGKGSFRGTSSKGSSVGKFNLGTTGFVFGGMGYNRKSSFAITATQVANFNQYTYYKGQNNYSSFAEPLANEFAASGLTIDNALNSDLISLQTKMALYTYLVDTATVNGSLQVIARPEFASNSNQENIIDTKGGITDITFGLAEELSKKFLVGMSLGIPVLKLDKHSIYIESDASGNTNNDFGYLRYTEDYRLTGVGLNLKGGFIYRPREYIRLGLAFHTPSWILAKESFSSKMVGDVENLFGPGNGVDSVSSAVFTNNQTPQNKYIVSSPSRIIISGSYVFREVENIERQKGFITADIEYTNYKWMKFAPYDETTTADTYAPYNQAIDAIYKGAFNFKVGGELKFKILMVRAGFAYFGNPYKDKELKAGRMNLSGGLGYRNKGIFVDLTYVHHLNRDVNFPYRVEAPRQNTFADLRDNGGNVLLTFGVKI